ncbi:hypothetical protein BLA24_18335 [Streptomyces cinnamoneus]|uniref:Uncharacterized protein n=2 Tax=Streptomyces cinnamoneus TaxID=53446 RepID=A0A2G1XHN3_STRCJ|nr:hypothetical protein BLA24_18335 [Streptomyces cinnamoneus]PPT14003.1 hypothetical protein CYQ11_14945 [Streptomyces cinnamoneus]
MVVLAILVTGVCVWATADPHGCPRPADEVSASELAQVYEGPHGMRMRLRHGPDGRHDGAFSVTDWPYEGSSPLKRRARFDGSGEWRLTTPIPGKKGMVVKLDFVEGPEGTPFPARRHELVVGRDGDSLVLYPETDPDNCPELVLAPVKS